MSLLPSTVPPPNEPFGTTEKGDKVLLDKNWWLFLYNVAKNSIAGTPDEFLEQLGIAGIVSSDTDCVADKRAIANLQKRNPLLADPVPAPRIPLAILPDAPARAQPLQVITVGASPYTYVAAFNGSICLTAGTVSSVAIVRQGTSVATGLTVGMFQLSRSDSLVVTYSGTPTMTFLPA